MNTPYVTLMSKETGEYHLIPINRHDREEHTIDGWCHCMTDYTSIDIDGTTIRV